MLEGLLLDMVEEDVGHPIHHTPVIPICPPKSLSVIENCIRTLAKSWHIPSLADIERVEAVPPC